MSTCKQKFLGLDSINVLVDYINKNIEHNDINGKVCTIQLFKYSVDKPTSKPDKNIYFDFESGTLQIPEDKLKDGWNTLNTVVANIEDEAEGAIYMSSRYQIGEDPAEEGNPTTDWSAPVKVSGINGLNGKDGGMFMFSYVNVYDPENNPEGTYSNMPLVPTEENKNVYYWLYVGDAPEVGSEGFVWSHIVDGLDGEDGKDGKNGIEMHYRYYVTSVDDVDKNNKPIRPNDNVSWSETIMDVSKDYPYLWVRSQQTVAGEAVNDENWSDAKLLSKYGQDGTAPEYNMTLYKWSEGYLKPEQPTLGEFNEETDKYEFIKLNDFRANNPSWLDVPTLDVAAPVAVDVESTVEVSTVKDITDNLVDGKIIKLSEDLQIPTPIIITEGNVTIDLNGHTITAGNFMESNGEVLEGDTDSYVFWIKGGHLTIQGNGKVVASPAKYSMAVWSNGGDVTIKGGHYENGGQSCDLIYGSARIVDGVRQGGTIKIYGGEFYATLIGEEAGTGNKRSALNTKNADMDICKIEVYGGYFHEFDPSNNLSLPGSTGNFLGEGVKLVNNNGVFEVVNSLLPNIWWQCTIKINGAREEIMQIGTVERYTAIDGAALPGEYTKFKYKWFDTQVLPEDFVFDVENWNDTPDKDVITRPEASLWMVSAVVNGINAEGDLNIGEWSNPVKITGPINTVTRFCRLETRYDIGNEKAVRSGAVWFKTITEAEKKLNSINRYLYAAHYNIYYSVSFDKENNTYAETPIDELTELLGIYRLNGKDGKDGEDGQNGNKRNDVDYCTEQTEATVITSDSVNNYFVSNPGKDAMFPIEYIIDSDKLTDDKGFTYKFINITGSMNFKSKIPFILPGLGEMTEPTSGEYYSWSTSNNKPRVIEIIRYGEMGSNKKLIVITSDIDFSTI